MCLFKYCLYFCLDNEDPTLQCPIVPEHFAVTDQLSRNITLPDSIYHDNSEVEAGKNSSHASPAEFPIGVHEVRYQAWDASGNMASCSILVKITGVYKTHKTYLTIRPWKKKTKKTCFTFQVGSVGRDFLLNVASDKNDPKSTNISQQSDIFLLTNFGKIFWFIFQTF